MICLTLSKWRGDPFNVNRKPMGGGGGWTAIAFLIAVLLSQRNSRMPGTLRYHVTRKCSGGGGEPLRNRRGKCTAIRLISHAPGVNRDRFTLAPKSRAES